MFKTFKKEIKYLKSQIINLNFLIKILKKKKKKLKKKIEIKGVFNSALSFWIVVWLYFFYWVKRPWVTYTVIKTVILLVYYWYKKKK